MSEVVEFELKPTPDTCLSQMLEYGLSKHIDRYDSPGSSLATETQLRNPNGYAYVKPLSRVG